MNMFPDVILGLAGLAARLEENERAARLFGVLDHYRRGWVYAVAPLERAQFEANREAARAALGEARFGQLFTAGQEMFVEQTIAYALERSDTNP
jgi:thioesterase domain-containing protein